MFMVNRHGLRGWSSSQILLRKGRSCVWTNNNLPMATKSSNMLGLTTAIFGQVGDYWLPQCVEISENRRLHVVGLSYWISQKFLLLWDRICFMIASTGDEIAYDVCQSPSSLKVHSTLMPWEHARNFWFWVNSEWDNCGSLSSAKHVRMLCFASCHGIVFT